MPVAEVLIFIVEDEEIIRNTLQHVLEDSGFAVAAAANGKDAIDLLDQNEHGFRALVTDVDLGGEVSGWKVAQHARTLSPALPVVYMTGASAGEWSANGVPESVLLQKPFAFAQIVTAVTQLLNAASSSLPSTPDPPTP